jgi:AcrR family transcriptional regulator
MTNRKSITIAPARPDVRRRTRRGEETRRQIVDAAIECLNNLGYAGTSVEAVLEQSGLSRGSVLNQFPTRIDLMAGAIQAAMEAMVAHIVTSAAKIADPAERLRAMCDVFWTTQQLPGSTAVTEVLLAARWDRALAAALRPVASQIETEIDQFTAQLSRETGITGDGAEANLLHARILILSLRGITLELMYDQDRGVIHRALDQIRAMHQAHCDRVLGGR